MTEGSPFECESCNERVSPISYRATCPDCGGTLRRTPVQ
ncbi:rubrerythrin-like domain-containing protein [Haloplanus rallus]|uniref:Rubrerythrin-like domain-containing protein n=1 Tax=Haloplanus rallus TaxID=1816183 RepID=A0A6B9F4P7_9EURY|nr:MULTISPECIES: rubrerythrin-like domain-containing protein [Haloplanus]QGX94322.1 rubrerythrin-like domain-containing protein [Haloplanus rallus]